MNSENENPSAALLRLVNGYQVSQAIHVAATLGLADLLASGPCSSDDLAAKTDSDPAALYRLLRALASVGVFREEPGRRFALTRLGDCLRSDASEPIGPWATFIGRPYVWEAWAHLLHSVRTGENAFRSLHGVSTFEYRATRPDEGTIFDRAMTGLSRRLITGVLQAVDFGRFGTIADVGGGHGAFLAAILASYPSVRGILFDEPHVVAGAGTVLRAAGVADRCQVVGGDFFEAVPDDADAYILKAILNSFDDDKAVNILRTCRRTIGPDGMLMVVEQIIGPPNEDAPTKFADLNMLALSGGRQRTLEEFGELLAATGFQLVQVIPAGAVSITEAAPV